MVALKMELAHAYSFGLVRIRVVVVLKIDVFPRVYVGVLFLCCAHLRHPVMLSERVLCRSNKFPHDNVSGTSQSSASKI